MADYTQDEKFVVGASTDYANDDKSTDIDWQQ